MSFSGKQKEIPLHSSLVISEQSAIFFCFFQVGFQKVRQQVFVVALVVEAGGEEHRHGDGQPGH